ncbi:MAG: hypothetical protein F4Y60_00035 [Boseongicola sp. SB0664_bin_43]|uniref:Uncharacterized protein n=1 Tax=Boseongicola sp. SB0664_bin_43 TaxID=2604844 RepID=A0A6B0XY11_9RHOB|nr:hypothetical protein [Boseongicola sp. SB0664_bin_43]MYK30886.1 hypothetical protein [Boseongicola sp. SB0670_bin_30]
MHERGKNVRRMLPFPLLAATLGLAARDDETDLERAGVRRLAGCIAGHAIDEGNCLKCAAAGAVAGALADD